MNRPNHYAVKNHSTEWIGVVPSRRNGFVRRADGWQPMAEPRGNIGREECPRRASDAILGCNAHGGTKKVTDSKTQTGAVESPRAKVVALTGFMGSGKTTVGRELAALLGWALVDLDTVIEAREGRRIREIFRVDHEAGFRAIEQKALQVFLAGCRLPTILAMGGGAFVQAENADLLKRYRAVVVFLEVPADELLRRCLAEQPEGEPTLRPLANDEDSFRALYVRRLPAYLRADMAVDAADKSPTEIAAKIADALQEWLRE